MKRIISILTVIALFLTVLIIPQTAGAATVINDVAVRVKAPVPGQCPYYDADIDTTGAVLFVEDDDYGVSEENGIIWFCGDVPMLPTDTFEVGESYTVRVLLLRENDSYEFSTSPKPSARINENDAYFQYGNNVYISIEYTFPALEGYTVTFAANGGSGTMAPVENVAGDYTIPACAFNPPSNKEFKCWKIGDEEWFPNENYLVTGNLTLTAQWKTVSNKQQIYNIVATSEDLDTIPTLYGKTNIPKFTITEGAPAYINATTSNFRWMKKIGEEWKIQDYARFTPGEWRAFTSIRIDGQAAATYELGNPTTLTVNGKQWTPDNGTGQPFVEPTYSCVFFSSPVYTIVDDPNIQPPILVESADMQLEGYIEGELVDSWAVVSDAKVNIDIKSLFEVKGDPLLAAPEDIKTASGVFSTQKTYVLFIEIKGQDGYDISLLDASSVSLEQAAQRMSGYYNEGTEAYNILYVLNSPATHKVLTVTNNATLESDGLILTVCSVCGKKTSTVVIPKIASVTTTQKITYNGKTKTPAVTVKDSKGKVLKKGKDYTVTYAKGRKKFGKYKITVNFIGNYGGKKVIYFEIVPKGTKVSKLTAARKSLKVKIKREKKNVSGYQIQYSLKKNFKSAKTVTLKKNSITSRTIKKLKAKKTYYVRVRTYKTYKGKKYYSAWSKTTKKKTK